MANRLIADADARRQLNNCHRCVIAVVMVAGGDELRVNRVPPNIIKLILYATAFCSVFCASNSYCTNFAFNHLTCDCFLAAQCIVKRGVCY